MAKHMNLEDWDTAKMLADVYVPTGRYWDATPEEIREWKIEVSKQYLHLARINKTTPMSEFVF